MSNKPAHREILSINGISYSVKRLLSIGGSSRIYEAKQMIPGSGIASDVLIKAYYSHEDTDDCLKKEYEIGNIVRQYCNQVFPLEQAEKGYAVLKRVSLSCKPLFQILEEWEILPPSRKGSYHDVARLQYALNIVSSILNGVQRMHNHGVLFLDSSPGNIFYEEPERDLDCNGKDGTAYFIDFGLSQIMDENNEYKPDHNNVTELTCSYAAPEMISNGILTPASDLYSITALLLVLVAGKKIIYKDRWILTTREHPDRLYRSDFAVVRYALQWMDLPDRIREKLLELIITGLSPYPQKRFNQSAKEMYDAVCALADLCNSDRYSFENYCINAAQFCPQITKNPFNPLNPFIKCYGRESEYKKLQQFLDAETDFSWYAVTAPGGTGKTKLLFSFLMSSDLRGWKKEFNSWYILYIDSHEQFQKLMEFMDYSSSRKVLFVVDDIGSKTYEIEILMKKVLAAHGKPPIIRFLFAEREGFSLTESGRVIQPSWYTAIVDPNSREKNQALAERYYKQNQTLRIDSLHSSEHIINMMRDYCQAQKGSPDILSSKTLLEIFRFVQTKKELFSSLAPSTLLYLVVLDEYLHGNNLLNFNFQAEDLLEATIRRTEKSWKRLCSHLDSGNSIFKHARRIVIYATIMGRWQIGTVPDVGPFIPDATALNKLPADIMRQIASALNESSIYDGYVYGMKPDLIGEAFVANYIAEIENDTSESSLLAELLFGKSRFYVLVPDNELPSYQEESDIMKAALDTMYSSSYSDYKNPKKCGEYLLKIVKDYGQIQRYNSEITHFLCLYTMKCFYSYEDMPFSRPPYHQEYGFTEFYNHSFTHYIIQLCGWLLGKAQCMNYEEKNMHTKEKIKIIADLVSTLIDAAQLTQLVRKLIDSAIDYWSYYLNFDLLSVENEKEVFLFLKDIKYTQIADELILRHTIMQMSILPLTLYKDQEQMTTLHAYEYPPVSREIIVAMKEMNPDLPTPNYEPKEVLISKFTEWHNDFINGLKSLVKNNKFKDIIMPYHSLWQCIYAGQDKEAYTLLDEIMMKLHKSSPSIYLKAHDSLEEALKAIHEVEQYGIIKTL